MPGYFFDKGEWTYGRLFGDAWHPAGRLVGAVVMRRALMVVALSLCVLVVPLDVWASMHNGAYNTQSEALAACQLDASNATPVESQWHCKGPRGTGRSDYPYAYDLASWDNGKEYTYTWSYIFKTLTPSNPCVDNPPNTTSGALTGKVLQGYSFCAPTTDTQSGATVYCRMSVSVSGPPTMNRWGSWSTPGSSTATGATCDGTPGDGGWEAPDGTVPVPAPADPTVTPPQTPMPKTCGGGSCYDAAADKFCAVSGSGAQMCIDGATARGDTGAPGGCASSGDSTVCAGSPSAPRPPADKVPDPPTAITGSDSYTQADPQTGANQVVDVTTYTNQGAPQSSSGQDTGDRGPAPASSSPSPDDSGEGQASGGQSCNSPPICSGDAPTCMVVNQTWLDRCKADWYDLDGDHKPDWVGDANDLPQIPMISGDDPIGGNGKVTSDQVVSFDAVSVDSISEESWAGNTCPQLPNLTLFGEEITYGDQALFCDWLAKLRPIFLLVCGFIAMRILASGGKS